MLRWRSLSWSLLTAISAAGIGLLLAAVAVGGTPAAAAARVLPGLDPALRSAGCGFFYGLLAFHLQRVDPDDGHLQAGLVGAVCGIRSLGAPLALPAHWPSVPMDLPTVMMELIRGWLPLWLPLIGSALVLHSAQRLAPGLRPVRRP